MYFILKIWSSSHNLSLNFFTSHQSTKPVQRGYQFDELCLPPWNRETLDLAPLSVRPSVCLSVCPFVTLCVRSISFEHLVGFTNNFAQMSSIMRWFFVQCLGLTKVGSRSRSQFKIKHCMTVFSVHSISFEPLVGFTNNFAQMSSVIRRCAVPMFDQGRVKVKVRI